MRLPHWEVGMGIGVDDQCAEAQRRALLLVQGSVDGKVESS